MLTPSAAGGHRGTRGAGLTGVTLQLRECVTAAEDAPHNFLPRHLLLKSPQMQRVSGIFPVTCPLVFFSTACEGLGASPVALVVKNPPADTETQEMQVRSLGREDPLEEEWQPIPVFLPGESHGQRTLAGVSPEGRKGSDMT